MCRVSESLGTFTPTTLPRLLGAAVIISLIPLPRDYVLGNAGEAVFARPRATTGRRTAPPPRTQDTHTARAAPHDIQHDLLLLTCLLSLTIPVLAGWTRTFVTASVSAAIAAADHNVWAIARRISCWLTLRRGRATTLFSRLTGEPLPLFVQSFADLVERGGCWSPPRRARPWSCRPRRVRARRTTYV
jgi:hypothetical protein